MHRAVDFAQHSQAARLIDKCIRSGRAKPAALRTFVESVIRSGRFSPSREASRTHFLGGRPKTETIRQRVQLARFASRQHHPPCEWGAARPHFARRNRAGRAEPRSSRRRRSCARAGSLTGCGTAGRQGGGVREACSREEVGCGMRAVASTGERSEAVEWPAPVSDRATQAV